MWQLTNNLINNGNEVHAPEDLSNTQKLHQGDQLTQRRSLKSSKQDEVWLVAVLAPCLEEQDTTEGHNYDSLTWSKCMWLNNNEILWHFNNDSRNGEN